MIAESDFKPPERFNKYIHVFRSPSANTDGVLQTGLVVVSHQDALFGQLTVKLVGRATLHPAKHKIGLAGQWVEIGNLVEFRE